MKEIQNKIIKTELIDWKKLKWLQPVEFKKITRTRLDKLKKSLLENGFSDAFNTWNSNEEIFILDGCYRQKALNELEKDGISIPSMLPGNFISCKNKAEAKKLVLIYNSHYAKIDDKDGLNWFQDLKLDEIKSEILIPNINFEKIFKKDIIEDEVPQNVTNTQTKLGDIYELGNHRVLCGDSTKEEDFERLMDGKRSAMVFADPPYGIGYEYNSHVDKKGDTYKDFCEKWFSLLKKMDDFIFLTAGWKYNKYWIMKDPTDMMYWISRNKRTGGKITHFRKIEPIFVWCNLKIKYDLDYFDYNSDRADGLRELHSCPKPLKFIADAISVCKANSIIKDPFLGSGTTLIAAEQTGRKCYGIEIDPVYVDVIVQRWVNFTGIETIKKNGENIVFAKNNHTNVPAIEEE
jgi:DNA modification methylase